jgi:hypothetical protein
VGALPNGGKVILGPGLWKAHGLNITTNNTWLEGDSQFTTIIDCDNGTVSMLSFANGVQGSGVCKIGFTSASISMSNGTAAIAIGNCSEIRLLDFCVDSTLANGGHIDRGVNITFTASPPGYYILISRFRINLCRTAAIYADLSNSGTTIDLHVEQGNIGGGWGSTSQYGVVMFGHNNVGSGVGGAMTCSGVFILEPDIGFAVYNDASPTGKGSLGMTLIGCGADTCAKAGYDCTNVAPNSSGVHIIGCWVSTTGNPNLIQGQAFASRAHRRSKSLAIAGLSRVPLSTSRRARRASSPMR